MLSKEDYKKYLYQMLDIEKGMADLYRHCIEVVSDAQMKATFTRLLNEELEYYSIVEDAIRMIIR